MTFVPVVTTSAAAAAAAQHAEMLRLEEEAMTGYSSEENNGWEFKIVRASTPRFKRAEVVRRLAEEEAEAGWELLEKFDDNRIRFKRRIEHRADDAHRAIDPYRTRYGVSSDRRGLAIAVGIMLVVAALAAFFIFKAAS